MPGYLINKPLKNTNKLCLLPFYSFSWKQKRFDVVLPVVFLGGVKTDIPSFVKVNLAPEIISTGCAATRIETFWLGCFPSETGHSVENYPKVKNR